MKGREVEIPGAQGDRSLPGYAAIPENPRAGVVVIHEIFGRAPEVDAVADRFAAMGYAAVAPDLFAHGRLACIRATMRAMRRGEDVEPVRQARAARAWLCARSGVPEARVGLIGFCFGGGFALAAGRGWGAVSANYGDVPAEETLRGIGPTIACYGGRDLPFRAKPALLRERLGRVGAEHEVRVYPRAGHAFLTENNHPVASLLTWPLLHVRYDPEVAAEAWAHIDAFFERHLRAGAAEGA